MRRVLAVVAVIAILVVAWWLYGRSSTPATPSAAPSGAPGSAVATAAAIDAGSVARPAAIAPALADATLAATGSNSPPALGSGSNDIYRTGARVTRRILEVEAKIRKLVEDCSAQHPGVKGKLKMSVRLVHDASAGNLVAERDIDKKHTTITDKDVLQCATENVFAAEELLEQMRAEHDPTGGNIVFELDIDFPPVPKPKPDWPADDASPVCEPGTQLAGSRGDKQWCQKPDGTKQGDLYQWDAGKLDTIFIYVDGKSNSLRMRPLD
jgi:hypothetical protein